MSKVHTLNVVPSLAAFAETFSNSFRRKSGNPESWSPFNWRLARHIEMAYFNQDQLPIPTGTDAESLVAELIGTVALDVSVLCFETPDPFVGSRSLWFESAELSKPRSSPFLLIEEQNEFIGVYDFLPEEVMAACPPASKWQVGALDLASPRLDDAVVISRAECITEQHAWFNQATEIAMEEGQ